MTVARGEGFTARVKALLQVARPPPWTFALTGGLGLASAVLDGASLLTFLPLIQTLQSAASPGRVGGLSFRLLSAIEPQFRVAAVLGALCTLVLLKNAVDVLNVYVMKTWEGRIAHDLRSLLLRRTLASCADYGAERSRNNIVTVLATSSWKAAQGVTFLFKMVAQAVWAVILLAAMLLVSPLLSAVGVAFLLVIVTLLRRVTAVADRGGRQVVSENARFGVRMMETIHSLQLIRSFGREAYETERFGEASDTLRRRMLRLDLLWAAPGPIAESSVAVLIALLILAGSQAGVGMAALVTVLTLLYRLQTPARGLLESKLGIESLGGAVDDVKTYLAECERARVVDGQIEAPRPVGEIRFERVSFRYHPDGEWALRDVSFTIRAGEFTGIVGGSGAGKSTILLLLLRFYDPTEGRILVDGVPLASIKIASWRPQLALMSQDVVLLSDSLAANIRYGDLAADQEAVERAARIAGIHDFIEALPAGYATPASDAGARFSGGQRQRIALARAVVRNASVLLLDEATNALDAESERQFQHALTDYGKGRTVVAIAHRLTTVRSADQILVIERGRLIEAGPPDQLLSSGGRFSDLQMLQLSCGPKAKELDA